MSGDIRHQLMEARTMRNAARALVRADISHLKTGFGAKNVAKRITDRMTEGAVDVFEEAVEVAEDNRGALLTLIAAVILWFARNPIMSLFSDEEIKEYPDNEPSESDEKFDTADAE